MQIERLAAHASRAPEMTPDIATLLGSCVGCESCRGACAALIELLYVPTAVLDRKRRA